MKTPDDTAIHASLADATSTRTVDSGTAIVESTIVVPLVGEWQFAIGPGDIGEAERWHHAPASGGWSSVAVPHTWQIYPQTAQYFGSAWYRRQFHVPETWAGRNLRGGAGTKVELFDSTPPPLPDLPDEQARWKAVGLTPDGKILDPKHLE